MHDGISDDKFEILPETAAEPVAVEPPRGDDEHSMAEEQPEKQSMPIIEAKLPTPSSRRPKEPKVIPVLGPGAHARLPDAAPPMMTHMAASGRPLQKDEPGRAIRIPTNAEMRARREAAKPVPKPTHVFVGCLSDIAIAKDIGTIPGEFRWEADAVEYALRTSLNLNPGAAAALRLALSAFDATKATLALLIAAGSIDAAWAASYLEQLAAGMREVGALERAMPLEALARAVEGMASFAEDGDEGAQSDPTEAA